MTVTEKARVKKTREGVEEEKRLREEEKEERVTSTPGLRSNGRSERVD